MKMEADWGLEPWRTWAGNGTGFRSLIKKKKHFENKTIKFVLTTDETLPQSTAQGIY